MIGSQGRTVALLVRLARTFGEAFLKNTSAERESLPLFLPAFWGKADIANAPRNVRLCACPQGVGTGCNLSPDDIDVTAQIVHVIREGQRKTRATR